MFDCRRCFSVSQLETYAIANEKRRGRTIGATIISSHVKISNTKIVFVRLFVDVASTSIS